MFAASIHFLLRLIFVGKASVSKRTLLWQAPALPANVRLGWKIVDVANTLAYYDIATFTVVKSVVQAHGVDFIKPFQNKFTRSLIVS